MDRARVTVAFLNLGHFLDHLAMLIYATAVLAMTAEFGLSYETMLPLSIVSAPEIETTSTSVRLE